MSLTRIGSIGINTGIAFAGVTTIVTLNTANDALSIGATVNIGSGNLTVGSGVTVSSDGDVFFTGIATGNGSGLTALNASNISSGTVPTARLGSGTASSSTFLRGDSTFQTVNTDLVSDTSPQLGGDLDTNNFEILLDDNHAVKFGDDIDLTVLHSGSTGVINNVTGDLHIKTTGSGDDIVLISNDDIELQPQAGESGIKVIGNGAVEIYHDNGKKFASHSNGLSIKNEAGGANTSLYVIGAEGQNAEIQINADDGDDNADYWRFLHVASDNSLRIQNYGSGGWGTSIEANSTGNVELYHNASKKFETQADGATLTGDLFATSRIFVNTTDAGESNGDEATFANTGGNAGITIRSAVDAETKIYFSEGTSGGSQYRGAINYNHNTNYMSFSANEGEKMRILSGGGITFNGDTATANALDDYEEGTFTPTSNATLSASAATYTKIGRQVTCHIRIVLTSQSGGSVFEMTGLPFTGGIPGSVSNGGVPSGFGYISGGSVIPQIHHIHNGTKLQFYNFNSFMNISNVSSREYRFGLVYHTA